MKLKFAVLFVLGTAALQAQAPSTPQPAELKAFLNLTDSQVQSLITIRQQLPLAVQPVAQMAGQKQQALQQLLQSTSPDPAAVGKLVIDITALSQQAQRLMKAAQDQSLAVLQTDQGPKLQMLAQALQLQVPAVQAVALGLLNPPDAAGQAGGQAGGQSGMTSQTNGNKLMQLFPGDRAFR